MNQDRPGPDPDRILVAQLTRTTGRHARWRELTEAEEAATVAELRELAPGAAICWPKSPESSRAPVKASPASRSSGKPRSCAQAGRARRAAASRPPFSDDLHP
ncbi:MAG TPA: hypothetical protein VK280_16240 [Streptosporangiaceae bacterium]|nr:hypothetical protein [Streptosporangiaceae bacterium]